MWSAVWVLSSSMECLMADRDVDTVQFSPHRHLDDIPFCIPATHHGQDVYTHSFLVGCWDRLGLETGRSWLHARWNGCVVERFVGRIGRYSDLKYRVRDD